MSSADDVEAPLPSNPADAVADILEGRNCPDDAITSGELADRLQMLDGEANPKTRKLVKEVMKSHNLPVKSCHAGYYVADSLEEIEEELESLDGRIAGIQERKERLMAAYNRRKYNNE